MGLFITSVSLIQIITIYVGVYLTVSPLQNQLMWWVCDKLLLLHLFGLVLLWFYVAEINSTILVDYFSPNIHCELVFSPSYTISLKGEYLLNKPAILNLKTTPFLSNTQVSQSALVSTASILK